MKRLLAAGLSLALVAAAAPAMAERPTADVLFEKLKRDRYWRALDQAFPGEGPRLLHRELAEHGDPVVAASIARTEADVLPWTEPQLMLRAPDGRLLAQQHALADAVRLAAEERLGPCTSDPSRRALYTREVEEAWAKYRLAVMQSAAAGRRDPVNRDEASEADHARFEKIERKLRKKAGVPDYDRLEDLAPVDRCRAMLTGLEALERMPRDDAARLAAHMVGTAVGAPE